MNKFDVSIPRKMFWSYKVGNKEFCPQCHSKLENEYHTYLLIVKKRGDSEFFITGNDKGYFCPNCPVVVLDRKAFSELASGFNPMSSLLQFTVSGIVDLDAIPEGKTHLPLGSDDNPIPLVEFLNWSNKRNPRKKSRDKRRNRHKKRKKRK